jgi:hypothetical protein
VIIIVQKQLGQLRVQEQALAQQIEYLTNQLTMTRGGIQVLERVLTLAESDVDSPIEQQAAEEPHAD